MTKKHKQIAIFLLLFVSVVLFLFFRLFKIESSLLFFNDMGRDYLALLDFYETKKPPLLGPQTSVLSFNQSAVYFYLLFPIFIISGQSAFSSIYTVVFFYLICLGFGIYSFRKRQDRLFSLLIVSLFVAIQPQVIIQNRFVWNPSFLMPLLLVALFTFLDLMKKVTWKRVWLFSLACATAISLNYSSIPAVFAICLVGLFIWKKETWKIVVGLLASGLLINLPTIAFELRHKFVLTKLALEGQTLEQAATTISQKGTALSNFIIGNSNIHFGLTLTLCLLIITSLGFLIFKKTNQTQPAKELLIISIIFFISLTLTFILPINIESHYIFGIMALFSMVIALLPKKLSVLVLIVFGTLWLMPEHVNKYFEPARRTVSDMETCYENICKQEKDSIYVSMQSGILPYHNAPEHRYFMRQAGCNVLNIEETQNQSNKMAVVVDDSNYEHNKTAYNELTLFGPSNEINTYTCTEKLQVIMLQKN